jgi:hypothetical protein
VITLAILQEYEHCSAGNFTKHLHTKRILAKRINPGVYSIAGFLRGVIILV